MRSVVYSNFKLGVPACKFYIFTNKRLKKTKSNNDSDLWFCDIQEMLLVMLIQHRI